MPSTKLLEKYINSLNIAELLDDELLNKVKSEVVNGFELDRMSMETWLADADKIMDLANLPKEEKSWPWRKASNIKYPLMTTAIIQYASRTLPEMAKNGELVKYRAIGRDREGLKSRKGQRLAAYMNYKLVDEDPIWWTEHDKLLHISAAVGTAFVKSYYDPLTQKVKSEVCHYRDVIVNNNIKSIEEAPRISHRVVMPERDLLQGMRMGIYCEHDPKIFHIAESAEDIDVELVEQHTWIDLDDDGYPEPYIVLMHLDSNTILRIVANYNERDVLLGAKGTVARIDKHEYFTDFHFLPNPNGSFFSNGYGTLLLSLNDATNTILNQLVDAGTLANTQGGFLGKGLRIRKDRLPVEPGEWVTADAVGGRKIADEVYPLVYKEPSSVLYSLLGIIIQATKELTSTTEAMTGNVESQNTSPNTLKEIIAQGMTTILAIQRRFYLGLKKELYKVYYLYAQYVDPEEYVRVLDLDQKELAEVFSKGMNTIADFDVNSCDIVPVADLNTSSTTQRALMAQGIINTIQMAPGAVNVQAALMEYYIAMGVSDPERFLAPPSNEPSPDALKIQSDMAHKAAQAKEMEAKILLDAKRIELEEIKVRSEAIKNIAAAEAAEIGTQLNTYKVQADSLLKQADAEHKLAKSAADIQLANRELDVLESQPKGTDQ